jgi:hypothetical protein
MIEGDFARAFTDVDSVTSVSMNTTNSYAASAIRADDIRALPQTTESFSRTHISGPSFIALFPASHFFAGIQVHG